MLDIERDIHVNLRVYLEREREREMVLDSFPKGASIFRAPMNRSRDPENCGLGGRAFCLSRCVQARLFTLVKLKTAGSV